jgi:hypothetical protein
VIAITGWDDFIRQRDEAVRLEEMMNLYPVIK